MLSSCFIRFPSDTFSSSGIRLLSQLCRTLPPGVVDVVFPVQDDLRDRHKGVALLKQALNDPRQRLRRVEGCVVKQHDGTRLYLSGHPFGDFRGG